MLLYIHILLILNDLFFPCASKCNRYKNCILYFNSETVDCRRPNQLILKLKKANRPHTAASISDLSIKPRENLLCWFLFTLTFSNGGIRFKVFPQKRKNSPPLYDNTIWASAPCLFPPLQIDSTSPSVNDSLEACHIWFWIEMPLSGNTVSCWNLPLHKQRLCQYKWDCPYKAL